MTSPIPGVTYPGPRTWSAGDAITTPRLRGDMANLAFLFAGGARPLLVAQNLEGQTLNVGSDTPIDLGNSLKYLNSWNVPASGSPPNAPNFDIPFAGWYLAQGNLTIGGGTSGNQYVHRVGFQAISGGGSLTRYDAGAVPQDGVSGDVVAPGGLELIQFNTFAITGDLIAMYAFSNDPGPIAIGTAQMMVEWVALATSGLFEYTGAYGTVVPAPVAAAAFSSGQGATITNAGGIAAGATSVTVSDAAGMIAGGTLGLDFIAGQQQQVTAEAVSITSVATLTIGISATSYSHSQGAPVAVPVSAAFLNQQCRDLINFLAYPPLLRAVSTTTQSIATSGFPPTVGANPTNQITNMGTGLVGGGIDTFSGFASNAYTIPVAGTYLVYGQVPYTGATVAFACGVGISVNSGTILWGTLLRSNTTAVQGMCPTFRRLMRFSKGDVVTLWAYQGSGSAMTVVNSANNYAKLILVYRSF